MSAADNTSMEQRRRTRYLHGFGPAHRPSLLLVHNDLAILHIPCERRILRCVSVDEARAVIESRYAIVQYLALGLGRRTRK